MNVLITIIFLLVSTDKTTSITRKKQHARNTVPYQPPSIDWEVGLRAATTQALLRDGYHEPHLRENLRNAPFLGKQDVATPFGDVAIVGRGQLYENLGVYFFVQDLYHNDCDECHNNKKICKSHPCDSLQIRKPNGHERLVALWTTKRIRHRDAQGHPKYELEYVISPVRALKNHGYLYDDGRFNYAVPGHVFVVRTNTNRHRDMTRYNHLHDHKYHHNGAILGKHYYSKNDYPGHFVDTSNPTHSSDYFFPPFSDTNHVETTPKVIPIVAYSRTTETTSMSTTEKVYGHSLKPTDEEIRRMKTTTTTKPEDLDYAVFPDEYLVSTVKTTKEPAENTNDEIETTNLTQIVNKINLEPPPELLPLTTPTTAENITSSIQVTLGPTTSLNTAQEIVESTPTTSSTLTTTSEPCSYVLLCIKYITTPTTETISTSPTSTTTSRTTSTTTTSTPEATTSKPATTTTTTTPEATTTKPTTESTTTTEATTTKPTTETTTTTEATTTKPTTVTTTTTEATTPKQTTTSTVTINANPTTTTEATTSKPTTTTETTSTSSTIKTTTEATTTTQPTPETTSISTTTLSNQTTIILTTQSPQTTIITTEKITEPPTTLEETTTSKTTDTSHAETTNSVETTSQGTSSLITSETTTIITTTEIETTVNTTPEQRCTNPETTTTKQKMIDRKDNEDDIFGPLPTATSTVGPQTTPSKIKIRSDVELALFGDPPANYKRSAEIIYSNFYVASTVPADESVVTSISFEVNKYKSKTYKRQDDEKNNGKFDDQVLKLINHARTIDYLDKTTKNPKYSRRNYSRKYRKITKRNKPKKIS